MDLIYEICDYIYILRKMSYVRKPEEYFKWEIIRRSLFANLG